MKILVAGDFCPSERVAVSFERKDYAFVLSEVPQLTQNADYSIVNFECPVVYNDASPIIKKGPNLKSSANGVEAIKYAGFNCVTLANNHFFDYGNEGVKNTLSKLNEYGIDYVGGGVNIEEASRVLYKNIGGEKIAIINCCEHEFSIATNSSGGSNPLNPINQYYVIKEAKKLSDYVLVIVHGGHELFQLPSPRMVETYRFFVDAGADAVVNHHQHCYSGYEVYNNKPIFYGLGNFCFDDSKVHSGIWTEGYAVTIYFTKEDTTFSMHPYRQCFEEARIEMLPQDVYRERIEYLNSIISTPVKLKKSTEKFYSYCTSSYRELFEPIRNRYLLGAIRRGWLKSLIKKERKTVAKTFIMCESHRDVLSFWLDANS